MNRRNFIKQGGLFVPAAFGIFIPRMISADAFLPHRRKSFRTVAAAGSCPADGSPSEDNSTENDTLRDVGSANATMIGGQHNWNNASARTICKLAIKLTSVGTISGKTYNAYIFTSAGANNINVPAVATSDNVTGATWSETWVVFPFSTPYSYVSGNISFGVSPLAIADAANYIQLVANSTAVTGVNGYCERWSLIGSASDGGSRDAAFRVYWQ